MAELTPSQSANLAGDIYLVQKDFDSVKLFFKIHKSILSNDQQTTMKAKVGSRLINTRDTFGVCTRATGVFENELFLIFRGSNLANYCAD